MTYSIEIIEEYIKSLTKIEKLAMKIAEEDLGTSFNIEKSIGFLKWIKKNKV
jgi:hypothetical protein